MDREGNGEAAALVEPKPDAGGGEADSVGEKRPLPTTAAEVESEDVGRDAKKLKKNSAGEMRQVAEMLLVLSAMGRMRGGRDPTEDEVKLMVAAKDKLAEICQRFAPKELVNGDAVGKVIEDLGLDWKLNDQRLGFRGSRMSIKEKVAHAQKKMEEPKVTPHVSQTSHAHQSFAVTAEGRVPTHTVRPLPFEKPTHASLPSGTAPVHHSPFTHVSATAAYMKASNAEAKGAAASVRLPINHVGNSSVVAAPRGQFIKVEGGPNANTYTLNPKAPLHHPLGNAPTWSLQPSPLPSTVAAGSKVPSHTPVKADGIADSGVPWTGQGGSQAFRPPITQSAATSMPSVHQPTQTVKAVYSNHSEIAKVVQKLLQPKLPERPTWTLPSREYMNKALTCQSCNLTINEVENVIICDACEKGFHLKCLESVFQKVVPRTEWHCMKCTSLSNGKPFPPKYGRVMRSMTPPKGPASATQAGAQSLSDKKLVNMGQKGDQDKMSSVLESVTESGTSGCVDLVSGSKIGSERGLSGNSITSKEKGTSLMSHAGTLQNEADSRKPPGPIHDSSSVALSGETCSPQIQACGSPIHDKRSTSEQKLDPPALLSGHIHDTCEAKSQHNVQDVAEAGPLNTAKDLPVTCQGGDVEESKKTSASGYDIKQIEEGDAQASSPSLHNDKQSEVDPGLDHDVKQSEHGVPPAPSASEQNVKQGEQPAPSTSEQNVKQSEQGVGYSPSASEQNAKQSEQGVGHAPSASEHIAVLGVGHVASASEHNVKQSEQDEQPAPSASEQNVKQRERDVACAPPAAEHNSMQSEHGVAHGPSSSSEHNVNQSEQGVVPVPASEHNAVQSEQDIAHAPSSSKENAKHIEPGGVHAPSEHNVDKSDQGVADAPSAEQNVEQSEQGVAHTPSGSEHTVEQSEQGVAHAPSASEHNVEQSEPDVAHGHPAKNTSGSSNSVQLSPEVLQTVEWVGSTIKVFDDKAFYESCCIGGVVYKVLDHALFHSSHGRLIPSKIQVYDSNHEIIVMAGLIQGSCKVLPPVTYKEEAERRSQLAAEINNKSEPVFLCKYVYLFAIVLYSCF
ncbi:unnamed protein product [Linum tenue]|uniref:PHD-type domain-containing protein n=1 Tax=Linum tenue TaxID=586396 RepID=A0AAV0LT80_9ROSI|nr:unnamed protein product [Linum tenue]